MNHMAEVAKMLGVEMGEVFQIKVPGSNYNVTAFFRVDGLSFQECDVPNAATWFPHVLKNLITGTYIIKRKPWKPKADEFYWIVNPDGEMSYIRWYNESSDFAFYKLGNCYHTKAEAEADRNKWIAFYASDEVLEV